MRSRSVYCIQLSFWKGITKSNSCPTHIELWPRGFKAYPDLKCPYLFAQVTVRKKNRIELIEWSYLWSMSEDDDEEEPGWLSFLAVISSATMLIMQSLPNKVWNLIRTATEHFTGNMSHANIGQTNLPPLAFLWNDNDYGLWWHNWIRESSLFKMFLSISLEG